MFCFQCEQTYRHTACNWKRGVCGKTDAVALLQDQLLGTMISIAKSNPKRDDELNRKVIAGLFSTITNANFYSIDIVKEMEGLSSYLPSTMDIYPMNHVWKAEDKNIRTLKSLILFGLKGMAAYAYHALVLGFTSERVNDFFYEALAVIGNDELDFQDILPTVMKVGEVNYLCMELLDHANTSSYGNPELTEVTKVIEPGPFIVVTGHDLRDLKLLLEQTEGTGVNVYTHGEMLPANAYPELKKYPQLKGNFGTAWQNQQKEFANVPAAFLYTTNCLMPPKESYSDRIYSTGVVGYPGMIHIDENKDFRPVIARAKALGGYTEPKEIAGINGGLKVMTGFGHDQMDKVFDDLVASVKAGHIKHFFVVGGCDGARMERNYFTNLVKSTPKDTIVLTMACGKYRFNDMDLGTVDGFPRLLDIGQCNDSYSAIRLVSKLVEAFDCGVNDLPLTFLLAWYEQKAVAVLLTLLYLGVKNIKLGPTLPAFLSPEVLDFLEKKFGLRHTTTVVEDLQSALA